MKFHKWMTSALMVCTGMILSSASPAADRLLDSEWSLARLPNGLWNIKNRVSGLCLGVVGVDSHSLGARTEVYYCNPGNGDAGLDNQWNFEAGPDDHIYITDRVSNLCLGVVGVDVPKTYAPTEVYACDPAGSDRGFDNQWRFVTLPNGYFHIRNRVSGYCLGVAGVDSHRAGARTEVYQCSPE